MTPRRPTAVDPRLTLDHLRSFLAVAEELNFRRAAARLHIEPSPLSRRIRQLEDAVGSRLFERDTRSVRLTGAGKQLVPLATDALQRVNRLTWALRDSSHREFRIGVAVGVHPDDRRLLTRAARSTTSKASVATVAGETAELVAEVVGGQLHLVALVTPSVEEVAGLSTLVMREEEFGVAVAASAPVARHERIRLEQLASLRLATPAGRGRSQAALDLARLAEVAGAQKQGLSVPDVTALVNVIAAGGCFAFTPLDRGSAYRRALEDPEIAIRPLTGVDYKRVTVAAWLTDRGATDPLVVTVLASLRAALDDA